MGRLIIPVVLLLAFISSCGTCHHLPPKEETIIHYIDSTVWHDSTIINYLTKERFVDIVKPLDTLNLETSYAKAQTYLDTSSCALRGSIENKTDIPIETKIKWKEKIVYRDNIKIKEVPVEVVVTKEITKYPKTYWWFMGFTILSIVWFAIKLYLKFKI